MKKRLFPTMVLIFYIAILIKVMVFKDIPLIRVGHIMLNFGGIDASHPANFVPFKTILFYLFGDKGLIIAGINLVGNIILLVPIGILVPMVFRTMNWKKSLILAIGAGLIIETLQVVLHVGIFDIDDVILNALGVMIGYAVFVVVAGWIRAKRYKTIVVAVLIFLVAAGAVAYIVYPKGPQPMMQDVVGDDLCGGTGGTGQIISIDTNTFTIKQRDSKNQLVTLAPQATINTSRGVGSISSLKIGDRVTLVGDAHPDDTFTAEAVFICTVSETETHF